MLASSQSFHFLSCVVLSLGLADLPAEEEEPLSYHQAKVKPRKLHTWSDDPEDVEIRLGLPEEVTKREQITVTVSPNSHHVTVSTPFVTNNV